MNIHLLCKRYYTHKDLLKDRFGRLYHLPLQLARLGASVKVTAIDYRNAGEESLEADGVRFLTAPAALRRLPGLLPGLYRHIRAERPDLLIASGDSHIGFIGYKIAQRLGAHFIFDVYDYYCVFPGNRIPGMKAMFWNAVKRADLVLCASATLQARLAAENPSTLLVQNGVDRTLFVPGDQRRAREALGLPAKGRVVGYFGSINPARGPLLIEACRQIRLEMPDLRLLLAGPVRHVEMSEPWITHVGAQPQEAIPTLIHACDVVTIPYANDEFNSMAGACKIAEYLACDKPVVATRVAGHEEIFRESPGSLSKPDTGDMARAIKTQLESPKLTPFPETMAWEWIGTRLYRALNDLGT